MISSSFLIRLVLQLILMVAVSVDCALAQQEIVGDRLVVELNGVKYTQRQVESYYLVKVMLSQVDGAGFVPITPKTWPQILQMFQEEMILEQEAQRLGSFRPVERIMTQASKVLVQRLRSSGEADNAAKRLGIEGDSLNQVLQIVLRIEAFRQNKQRQLQAEGDASQLVAEVPQWFTELVSRAVFRTFSGAENYVLIQPTLGLRASNVE